MSVPIMVAVFLVPLSFFLILIGPWSPGQFIAGLAVAALFVVLDLFLN